MSGKLAAVENELPQPLFSRILQQRGGGMRQSQGGVVLQVTGGDGFVAVFRKACVGTGAVQQTLRIGDIRCDNHTVE